MNSDFAPNRSIAAFGSLCMSATPWSIFLHFEAGNGGRNLDVIGIAEDLHQSGVSLAVVDHVRGQPLFGLVEKEVLDVFKVFGRMLVLGGRRWEEG